MNAGSQVVSTPPRLPPSVVDGVTAQSLTPLGTPTATIPFAIGDPESCSQPGRLHRVSLRIYNILAQLVAVPILKGGKVSEGRRLDNVPLECGAYTAFWDGSSLSSGREAASGMYLYRLEVDGRAVVRKVLVTKEPR